MQRKTYASRLCVLLFLIIENANVNALSLTSCDNPLENEVCNLTCTTTDHLVNVVFDKEPDIAIIAQCVTNNGCFGSTSGEYSISQPNSMSTILSFMHSRNNSGTWRCSYGSTPTSVSVPWATYPLTVTTTLTSNTTVDTNIDGNVTLWCLYSEQAPTVTLQYQDANGNNDAMSAETFQCNATDSPCTDVDFTTYECPVVVKEETGIDNSHTYSIKVKIKVSHVQTEDVHTIVTDIAFKRPTTTAEQQTTTREITTDETTTHETTTDETTTHETTTDETTTHETTTDETTTHETATDETTTHETTTDETTTHETTTDETTTMETNNGLTDNLITIIIGIILGACVLIGIIIIIIIVLVKKRCHKSDNVKTTKQENYNETREPTANKTDTLDHMAMQHGKPRNHAVSKPGNPGLVYAQYDNHVGYYDGNRGYDRRNYYGNPEHEPLPKEPTADYNRKNYYGSHL